MTNEAFLAALREIAAEPGWTPEARKLIEQAIEKQIAQEARSGGTPPAGIAPG